MELYRMPARAGSFPSITDFFAATQQQHHDNNIEGEATDDKPTPRTPSTNYTPQSTIFQATIGSPRICQDEGKRSVLHAEFERCPQ